MDQPTPATPPEAKSPKPVMDVVPPRASQPEPVKTPPKEEAPEQPELIDLQPPKQRPEKKAEQSKPPNQPRSGVGVAILAAVVIVLSLAAMFVYAYLRTQGASPN